MKIRFERRGVVFEYERQPMKESRFRALCALAAAGVYAGLVAAITALCGGFALREMETIFKAGGNRN